MARIVTLFVALAVFGSSAFAQGLPVAVDQRVRVTTTDATRVGRVVSVAAEILRPSAAFSLQPSAFSFPFFPLPFYFFPFFFSSARAPARMPSIA